MTVGIVWTPEMIATLAAKQVDCAEQFGTIRLRFLESANAALYDSLCSLAGVISREFGDGHAPPVIRKYQAEFDAALGIICILAGREYRP